MGRKATEQEQVETTIAATATAADFAALGQSQVFASEEALLIGVVALAVGRVAHVQGWGGADKGKVADYDDVTLDAITASRAKFYRLKTAMVKGSARLNKDLKNTLDKARHEGAEQATATVVAALRAEGVDGFMAFYAWAANKEDSDTAKPSLEDQVLKIFCGSEKNPDGKIAEIGSEALEQIAQAITAEISRRVQVAAQAAQAA